MNAASALVSNIDYDNYIADRHRPASNAGIVERSQNIVLCDMMRSSAKSQNRQAVSFRGVAAGGSYPDRRGRSVGRIVCVAGIPEVNIGDTICDPGHAEPLPFVTIDEPTIAMTFSVKDSPFAGREGRFVTSRHLRERLFREMETNVSMRLEETDTTESFVVKGRG